MAEYWTYGLYRFPDGGAMKEAGECTFHGRPDRFIENNLSANYEVVHSEPDLVVAVGRTNGCFVIYTRKERP